MSFINILGKLITKVATKNMERKDVKTADASVFEAMKKKAEELEKFEGPQKTSRSDMYKGMSDKVKEVQKANEADPNVETAHSSVFTEMLEEIDRLKHGVEPETERVFKQPQFSEPTAPRSAPSSAPVGAQAWTNSQGGSLAIRTEPSMASPKRELRIPDSSILRVLEYSDNAINLDGKMSRFALVEYEGQRGWILESYLNFN